MYLSPDLLQEFRYDELTLAAEDKNSYPVEPLPEDDSFEEVKEKLVNYCRQHNSEQERWLLSSHAHCFILLS